jgi:hypothetical protein
MKKAIEKTGPKEALLLPGYPHYPPSEDIYVQGQPDRDLDPDNPGEEKAPNEEIDTPNEKEFDDDLTGEDLDVPGSELDDQQESVGSEDEENNYYSLGGDNHNDLEEDNCQATITKSIYFNQST